MYKIKEFSILSKTTIKALRYYDKINLLKPIKIDEFTGYRYYDESQIEIATKIKNFKLAGFSLNEIKDLLQEEKKDTLNKKIKQIEKESIEKIEILQKMKKDMKENIVINKPKLITNPTFIAIGKTTTIKSRKEINKVLQEIDKTLKKFNLQENNVIIDNYEATYKEKDIRCFIGKIISNKQNPYYIIKSNKKLKLYKEDKPPTMLHVRIEKNQDLNDAYINLIKYANKNNIQTRGSYKEIYHNNYIDVYIEAYDLSIENEDELKHRKELKEKLKDCNTHPKKYVGKWKLVGEIIEPPYLFSPKDKHYKPKTKYETIDLKKDGTTNFKNITWKDKYLIEEINNTTYYHYIGGIRKKGLATYLDILINTENTSSNARPYQYYYKKIK